MLRLWAITGQGRLFESLQYRDYRLFWFGQLISVLGFQMLMLTQIWLVYDLTGSTVQLGLVGLSSAVPSIVLNLFGGVVADKVNPRRLIMGSQLLGAVVMVALATLTVTDVVQAWHVMIAAFLMGGLGAFDGPSRQSIFPHLIDRRSMQNAVALNSVIWQGTRIVGPAAAGILIGVVGPAIIFYMTAVGFVTFVLFLAAVRMPAIERRSSGSVMQDMGDGLAFIRRNFIFMFLLGMTFFNSFFGLSYVQLLPVFQKDVLHVSESGLGLLAGMAGTGALAGTFIVAAMGGIRRKGLVMIGGAMVFGVMLVLFGYSRWFWISVPLVALAGLSSSIYMVLAQTTLQMLVPDQFRGRVMGIWGITYNLMPMGGFQAGMVASLVDARFAVALGGVAVIGFALLGAARSTQVRGLGVLPVPEVRSPS